MRPLIAFALLIALAVTSQAQQTDKTPPTIQQLDKQLNDGTLNDIEYLAAAGEWVQRQFAAGVQFHRDTLIKHLATLQEIAWGADSLIKYRINYYIDLSNNATYANRDGEAIYFLEKAEQEITAAHGEKPLLVAGQKCNSYNANRNHRNVIATYEKERDYLKQFPELIRRGAINRNIAASFINVMNPTIQAYAQLGDSTGLDQALALAEQIDGELKKILEPTTHQGFIIRFYMKFLYFHKYFTLERNQQKAGDALHAVQAALYTDTTMSASVVARLAPVLEAALTDYFLTYNENDSAAHYLARLKNTSGVFPDHDYTLNLYEARLLANQGNYRPAFERAEAAVYDIDSMQSILVNEIDELLYAHTEAEFNRQALQVAEQQKQRRTLWLIAVSVAAALAVVITYVVIRRRNRKTKEQLDKLNQAANIQVAALEEVRAQAVRDEQKRLARDLHDGLSATLASAKLQLEVLAMDSSGELAERATRIQNQLEQAYAIARNKSHQWYDEADGSAEADFENRIQQVLDSALTDSQYAKEVHVDDHTLANVPLDVRIDLLRIVQEAITNTIKHAKASHISVLLYREELSLTLAISDDGAGMRPKKSTHTGIGIRSMRDRSEQYGGQLHVESNQQGTQVIASIPLAPPKQAV